MVAREHLTAPEVTIDGDLSFRRAAPAAGRPSRSRARCAYLGEKAQSGLTRALDERRAFALARSLVRKTRRDESPLGVAQHRLKARGRDPNTEKVGGHVFELMRFVEDDRVVVGQGRAGMRPA